MEKSEQQEYKPAHSLAEDLPSESFSSLRKIRVLLVLPSLHGGGAERMAVNIIKNGNNSGFEIRLALLRKSGPYLSELEGHKIAVSPLGANLLNFDGPNQRQYKIHKLLAAILLVPLNIRTMIRRERPDVVVSFLKGTSIATCFALASLRRRNRPKWVAREGNNTWAVIDDEISNGAGRRLILAVVKRVYRRSDCVLSISDALARDLKAWIGCKTTSLRTIPNAVNVSVIRRKSKEVPEDFPVGRYIISTGRLEHQKGHDLLIEAFARSSVAHSSTLLIQGTGSCREALADMAQQLEIADRVRFIGFQKNPWALIARADLFILPSRWEGFGSVIIESMAVGAPCLVTSCKYGPGEIIEHGVSGWIVPPNDVDTLSEAITLLMNNDSLRKQISERGRLQANSYDVEKIVLAYQALFAEVVSRV